MQSELHEVPAVLERLATRLLAADGPLLEASLRSHLAGCERVLFAACGSSRHAGLLGKYALSALADVPSQIEEAHELMALGGAVWRGPSLCVALSQSGETQDTLEGSRLAAQYGVPVLALANVLRSTLMREARWHLPLEAGEERAIPATKSFSAQAFACVALAWAMGEARAQRGEAHALALAPLRAQVKAALQAVPTQVQDVLAAIAPGGAQREQMERATALCAQARQSVFVGRGPLKAIVEEAALKLQESAYLPARGFCLGEIKHGPMAMLEPAQDVVVALLAPGEPERARAGVERLLAVGVPLVVIAPEGDAVGPALCQRATNGVLLSLPSCPPLVWPLLAASVVQRLSLDCAAAVGTSVDRPRYLVKQILTL